MNIQKQQKKKSVRSSKVKNVTQFKQSVNEFCPLEDRLFDFYCSLNYV